MAFKLGENLFFVDSLQFMNSSLEKLVKTCQKKNLSICLEFLFEKIRSSKTKGNISIGTNEWL